MTYISNIILDQTHHMPRKLSNTEEVILKSNIMLGKKQLISKYDEYDPYVNNKKIKDFVSNLRFIPATTRNTNSRAFSMNEVSDLQSIRKGSYEADISLPLNKFYNINLQQNQEKSKINILKLFS
jgi:hypothetical protein